MPDPAAAVWMAALTVLILGAIAIAAWALDAVLDARQAAQEAVAAVNQVIDHLAGTEPEGEGRHAEP